MLALGAPVFSDTPLLTTLGALVIVIATASLARVIAARIAQSMVIAEILAGILLGPSLFGSAFPAGYHWIFNADSLNVMKTLSQIGLVLFMFEIGLDLDIGHFRGKRRKTAVFAVAGWSIALSFGIGFTLASISATVLAPAVYRLGYECFLGTALSITALPVLSRILRELRADRLDIGVFGISAAAITDIAGWTLLAATTSVAVARFSVTSMAVQVTLIVGFVLFCWLVARPIMRSVLARFDFSGGQLTHGLIAAIFILIFLFAIITIQIGIFAGIGGFIAGTILFDQPAFARAWRAKFEDFLHVFFLPIYFTFTGLRTNIGGLNSPALWTWCFVIVLAATLGKLGVSYLVARFLGMNRRDSGIIGFMMNTRGLVELVVLNIGLDLGVIPPQVFTMLVLMAVISTAITPPALRVLLAGRSGSSPERETSIALLENGS